MLKGSMIAAATAVSALVAFLAMPVICPLEGAPAWLGVLISK